MSKNSVIAAVLVAILAIAGIVFYVSQTPSIVTPSPSPSPTESVSTPPEETQPGAPLVTTSSNTFPTDTTVIVSGAVVPNGAFTTYWYEYGTTSGLGSKTISQTIGSGYRSIPSPAFITGLAGDTIYYFRLVAENEYSRVPGATFTFQTTHGNPPPVGSAPTTKTVAATGVSRTAANLNGEVTPNSVSTTYWFEYGKTPNLGQTSSFANAGDGTTKLSAAISLSDLDPLTTYYFRINAQNQFGTVNGAILNFKTAGPAGPTSPTVVTRSALNVATSTATLRGTVTPNGAETTYWFEYSTDSLLGAALVQTTQRTTAGAGATALSVNVDVTRLNPKTTYFFRFVAQNSRGTVRGDRMTFKTK